MVKVHLNKKLKLKMKFLRRFLNKINNIQKRLNRINLTLTTSLLDKKKLYGNNKNNNLQSLPLLKMNKNQLKLNWNQKLLKLIKWSLRKMKTKILLCRNHIDQTTLMILTTMIYMMPYLLVYLSLLLMALSVIMQLLKKIVDC